MSESVEILIKAEDKYSQEFAKANRATDSLVRHQNRAAESARNSAKAFSEMGGRVKVTTEFVGTLAGVAGGSELAGFASQIAGVTERVSALNNMAKEGGASAVAFRLGLVGLVGTLAVGLGKAIGDSVFQTEKWRKEMQGAREDAAALNAEIAKSNAQRFSDRREDIELIRNPEEKKRAYQDLLAELNRDIAGVTSQVESGKKAVEEWNSSWKFTGNQRELAKMAEEDLKVDRERLAALRDRRRELQRILSVRAEENAQITAENAAKEKSEAYVEQLRQEVQYMQATREEQIRLDAARNVTVADRGEAERLLRERDAIVAKAEAERQAEADRQRAADERQRMADQAAKDADREVKRVEDLVAAEEQRLKLQAIELEQGKEAARAQSLIDQGVDDARARALAAEEQRLAAERKRRDDEERKKTEPMAASQTPELRAQQSRLLTRGPANRRDEMLAKMQSTLATIAQASRASSDAAQATVQATEAIRDNTSRSMQLVPTS